MRAPRLGILDLGFRIGKRWSEDSGNQNFDNLNHEANEPMKARLILTDGTCFEGLSLGAMGTTSGEVLFNTAMM